VCGELKNYHDICALANDILHWCAVRKQARDAQERNNTDGQPAPEVIGATVMPLPAQKGPDGKWYLGTGGMTSQEAIKECFESHKNDRRADDSGKMKIPRRSVDVIEMDKVKVPLVMWYNSLEELGGYAKVSCILQYASQRSTFSWHRATAVISDILVPLLTCCCWLVSIQVSESAELQVQLAHKLGLTHITQIKSDVKKLLFRPWKVLFHAIDSTAMPLAVQSVAAGEGA
jgi:hypothetical protein